MEWRADAVRLCVLGSLVCRGWGQASVAEIPVQYPRNADENINKYVPSFQYKITPTTPVNVLVYSRLPTCGSVMQPYHVTYVLNFKGYTHVFYPGCGDLCFELSPEVHDVLISTWDVLQKDITRLAVCNPYSDLNCHICVLDNSGVEATITVYKDRREVLMTAKCVLMEQVDCGAKACINGQYATAYLQLDARGYVVSNTHCKPCPPGTWLTCKDDPNCYYEIPSAPGTFDGGEQIYAVSGEEPVGTCFSCARAGNNKVHYGQTNQKTVIGQASSSGPLPWYCPGSWMPPVLCPAPFLGSNANHTFCACPPGTFIVGGAQSCEPCPPGYMCPEGVMVECPDNFYQDKSGSSMCIPCLFEGGFSNACELSGRKLRRCVGQYKSQKLTCVYCNACRHPYETESAGVEDCY